MLVEKIENRKTLEKLRQELDILMQSAGNLYDDKLNLTVGKLDIVTTKKLQELEELVNKTNSLLQKDITLAGKETRETIQALSNAMRGVTRDIENVIVVGGMTGVYVVDRSTNNMLSIIALVMVGIGLLLSFKMFFKRGMPVGKAKYIVFTSMGSYLLLFSLMLFSPTLRAYAMSYSGIGLKKSINAERLEVIEEDEIDRKKKKKLRQKQEAEKREQKRKQKKLENERRNKLKLKQEADRREYKRKRQILENERRNKLRQKQEADRIKKELNQRAEEQAEEIKRQVDEIQKRIREITRPF